MKKVLSVLLIVLVIVSLIVASSCSCSLQAPETPNIPEEPPGTNETPPEEKITQWYISLPIPREISQTNSLQTVESLKITSNLPPLEITEVIDEYGNVSKLLTWDTPAEQFVASLEIVISRKVNQDFLNSSYLYPIPENLLPEEVREYLKPSKFCQSDDPTIVAQAEALAEGLIDQIEVVNATISWINQNIEWKCSREWLNPEECEKYGFRYVENGFYTPINPEIVGARWTIKYRIGVCSDFANLAIALLRAQGIPARFTIGLVAYPDSPRLEETDGSHAWIEVYYPETGWVDYDPIKIDHLPGLPYHMVFKVLPDITAGDGVAWPGKFSEKWTRIGLGDNKVKITYAVTLEPKI